MGDDGRIDGDCPLIKAIYMHECEGCKAKSKNGLIPHLLLEYLILQLLQLLKLREFYLLLEQKCRV